MDKNKQINTSVLDSVREESIQPRMKRDHNNFVASGILGLVSGVTTSPLLPPWWSRSRDLALRNFWKRGDHLSSAIYTLQTKIGTVPFRIVPKNMNVKSHQVLALEWQHKLENWSQGGQGWDAFLNPWIEDLLGTDNGGFFEIVDNHENKLDPIMGKVLYMAQLDAGRCRRTGEAEYPVIYEGDNGLHKLHYTRVSYVSQMPSAAEDKNGVGFCAVSRAIHNAQNMIDIATYNEEKLGSRPLRAMLLVGGGLDAEPVSVALEIAAGQMDDRGLQRYSMMPIVGDKNIKEPSVELVNIAQIPDGFDQQQATIIAIASIALAFGMDARELFPTMGSGSTRADALLQHIKQRSKAPGSLLKILEHEINWKVLPNTVFIQFDQQDDAQDKQRAEINKTRSTTRKTNLEVNVTDERTEREKMLANGELTMAQFARLELMDGRLPDGKPLATLLFSDDPILQTILAFPFDNIFAIDENDKDEVLKEVNERRMAAMQILATESVQSRIEAAEKALGVLNFVENLYTFVAVEDEKEESTELDGSNEEEDFSIDNENNLDNEDLDEGDE